MRNVIRTFGQERSWSATQPRFESASATTFGLTCLSWLIFFAASDFLLESCEQVEGAIWSPLAEKPVIWKESSSVTIATEPSIRFLRLRKASP